MPDTTSERDLAAIVVTVVFNDLRHGYELKDLAQVFFAIDTLARELNKISMDTRPRKPPDDFTRMLAPRESVTMSDISMNSPLQVKITLLEITEKAVEALVNLVRVAMFRKHEKRRLAAVLASEWEDVNAKRLANIRTAMEIAMEAKRTKIVTEKEAARITRALLKLERSPISLDKIQVDKG
jgi:hypothetical protein